MANFSVFLGGLRSTNSNLAMFPSFPPDPTSPMGGDARSPEGAAKMRHLAWPGSIAANNCVSCGGYGCGESRALAAFCSQITASLAVGDTFDTHIIPLGSVLTRVYWRVDGAVTGLSYTLATVSDTGPSPTVTAITGSTINGAALGTGVFTLATPLVFTSNGLLRLVIAGLPTATAANASCRLMGASLQLAPLLLKPIGGAF